MRHWSNPELTTTPPDFDQLSGPTNPNTSFDGDRERNAVRANTSASTDDKYTPAVWNSSSQTVGTHAVTHWNFLEAMEQGLLVFSAASEELNFKATKFRSASEGRKPTFLTMATSSGCGSLPWERQSMPISGNQNRKGLLRAALHRTKETPSQCWTNLAHSRWAPMLLSISNLVEWKMKWKLITAKKLDDELEKHLFNFSVYFLTNKILCWP